MRKHDLRAAARRGLAVAGITGGLTLLGIGLGAAAASASETNGQDGVLSGNQTGAVVTASVEASGNQITVVGNDNSSAGSNDASVDVSPSRDSSGDSTSGEDGIGSGNQTAVGADAPVTVTVTGNQITVIGNDNTNGGTAPGPVGQTPGGDPAPTGGNTTSGEDGIGSGNQTHADVTTPVTVTGNQITVIGNDNTNGGTAPGPVGHTPGSDESTNRSSPGEGRGNAAPESGSTSGDEGGRETDTHPIAGSAGGGPGMPATGSARVELPASSGDTATVLPATGSTLSTQLIYVALLLMLAGAWLATAGRSRRKGAFTA
jgi:LPXTG-motif cell wall-anchored protein